MKTVSSSGVGMMSDVSTFSKHSFVNRIQLPEQEKGVYEEAKEPVKKKKVYMNSNQMNYEESYIRVPKSE